MIIRALGIFIALVLVWLCLKNKKDYLAACSNLQEEIFEVKNMRQVMMEMLEEEDDIEEDKSRMNVLCNLSKVYGAATLLRNDVLDNFAT